MAFDAVTLEEEGKFPEAMVLDVGGVKRRGGFTPEGKRFQNEYLVVSNDIRRSETSSE